MLAYMPVRNRTKYMRKAGICALFYRKSVGYGRGFRVLSLELVRQNFRRQTYEIHKIAVDFAFSSLSSTATAPRQSPPETTGTIICAVTPSSRFDVIGIMSLPSAREAA